MEKRLETVIPGSKGLGFLGEAARLPGVLILGIGPYTCLRGLFFSFYHENLEHKLFCLPISTWDFAAGIQVELAEQDIRQLIETERPRAILIYTSCSDLLVSTGYERMAKVVEQETGVWIDVLKRGSLSLGKMTPKERFQKILARWEEKGIYAKGGRGR